ncbi:MAG: hypothetical protein ACO3IL_07475 [Steroidobacteraceae bacterium]
MDIPPKWNNRTILKFTHLEATGIAMLSPVGLPPQLPVPPDVDLVPALERAIRVPPATAAAAQWQAGTTLSAMVRFQNDEMWLRIGEHFFAARPIPGLTENTALSLQVARNAEGAMMLVPLLPLAGQSKARIGGAPAVRGAMTVYGAGELAELADSSATQAASRTLAPGLAGALQALAARLESPRALAQWAMWLRGQSARGEGGIGTTGPSMGVSAGAPARMSAATSLSTGALPASVGGWMQAVTSSLAQSGLFLEARLKDRRVVPPADLKRQILDFIARHPRGERVPEAWAALDDMVSLQGAASLAHQSGGSCYSFVLPSPDGLGAWWITLQQDPRRIDPDARKGQSDADAESPPWRMRLCGISLPIGDIDIRIEQVGRMGVGVTLLTADTSRAEHWEAARGELSKRLEEAGLELARWAVMRADEELEVPQSAPGRLKEIHV